MALPSLPRWAWFAIGGLLLLVVFYVMLDRYGDNRFDAGKAQADAEWKAASERLVEKAHKSAAKADVAAAARAEDYAAKVEDERERISDATANGTSVFDVMFGG